MSLINDALKKAQKQRTGDTPPLAAMPGVGGEPAMRIARRAKPAGFNALLLRVGLGFAAFAAVIAVGIYFLLARPSTPPPAKPAVVAASPATPAVTPAPATTAPSSASTFVLPLATASPPPSVTLPAATVSAKPVVTLPVVVAPQPEAPKIVAPPRKLAPKSIAYIESLRVAGIRASATDSKVLMNDRVYRVGDIVEHELGIKITEIAAGALTFEDEHGGRYTRTF